MDDELRGIIFGALGEVSMCWEPQPGGIFDSVQATKIGNRIVEQIEGWTVNHSLKHTIEILEIETRGEDYIGTKVRVDSSSKYGTQIFWLKPHDKIIFDVEGVVPPQALDLLEAAWGLLANVANGDWSKELPSWQEAAWRWRDQYHKKITKEEGPTLLVRKHSRYIEEEKTNGNSD